MRKLDGVGGVRPGRDQATCDGGGCVLERNTAARGLADSMTLLSLVASGVAGGKLELAAAGGFADTCPAADASSALVTPGASTSCDLAELESTNGAGSGEPSPNQSESTDSVLGRNERALLGPSDNES